MHKLKPNQFYLPCGALITELPILFQTDMVQANLEDRKNQTRRTRGLQLVNVEPWFWNIEGNPMQKTVRFWDSTKESNPNPLAIHFGFKDPFNEVTYIKSPFGKPGDLLWVKETWFLTQPTHPEEYRFGYIAAGIMPYSDWPASEKFDFSTPDEIKPSIHMPKEASRIWLMIEDIRVERVQEISEGDAMDEGVEFWNNPLFKEVRFKDYQNPNSEWRNANTSFASLWISINGEESWQSNPWVWVIQYRILSKTGRPSMEVIDKNYLEVTAKEVDHVG